MLLGGRARLGARARRRTPTRVSADAAWRMAPSVPGVTLSAPPVEGGVAPRSPAGHQRANQPAPRTQPGEAAEAKEEQLEEESGA